MKPETKYLIAKVIAITTIVAFCSALLYVYILAWIEYTRAFFIAHTIIIVAVSIYWSFYYGSQYEEDNDEK